MDETPVSADMVRDTTAESVGKKDILMKKKQGMKRSGEYMFGSLRKKDETFHCFCSYKT